MFTQVGVALNSLPLTDVSHDPNDLEPLTPGHFLIGSPLNSLPEQEVQNVQDNCPRKYKLLHKLKQHFCARWSFKDLLSLQRRFNGRRPSQYQDWRLS